MELNYPRLCPDTIRHILEFCDMATICNMCIARYFNNTIEKYLAAPTTYNAHHQDIYYQIARQAVSGSCAYIINLKYSICTDSLEYPHTLDIITIGAIDLHISANSKCTCFNIMLHEDIHKNELPGRSLHKILIYLSGGSTLSTLHHAECQLKHNRNSNYFNNLIFPNSVVKEVYIGSGLKINVK